MKTSKVKAVTEVKGDGVMWRGVYYHNIELENGDKINIGKKTKLNPGDEISYEITGDEGQHEWTKAKSVNPDWEEKKQGKEDYTKGIEVGHAVNNAVNMICAGVEFTDVTSNSNEQKIIGYAEKILAIADTLKARR